MHGVGSCSFLYKLDQPIKGKIEAIATSYGASSVEYSVEAEARIERYTKQGFDTLPICVAKTQYSFSADANAKGAPSGFSLPIREVRSCAQLQDTPIFAVMQSLASMPCKEIAVLIAAGEGLHWGRISGRPGRRHADDPGAPHAARIL